MPLAEGALALLTAALRDPPVVLRYQAKLVTVPGSDCLWWRGAVFFSARANVIERGKGTVIGTAAYPFHCRVLDLVVGCRRGGCTIQARTGS